MAVLLRCAGWNLFRALAAMKKRGLRAFAGISAAFASVQPLADRIRRRFEAPRRFGQHNTALCPQPSPLAAA